MVMTLKVQINEQPSCIYFLPNVESLHYLPIDTPGVQHMAIL